MAQGRVEWTRLSGEEVETLLSVMLYRENPRAVRVRPSQGDGGIDVLIPNESRAAGIVDVYQIKKFATNLKGGQKGQIERSYRRLATQIAQNSMTVAHWYLMIPLDPTPENRKWFSEMPGRILADLKKEAENPNQKKAAITSDCVRLVQEWQADPDNTPEWKGLIACESLVASHPSVVDYYLYGGRDRLDSAVRQVASLLSIDRQLLRDSKGPDVQPGDLIEHLRKLQELLDLDPHFRYGVSVDPTRPELAHEKDLVAATQETDNDGRCLTFRIYSRFDEALNERPIPVKLKFIFENDSQDREAYEQWRKYGRPVTLPAQITADLPGGLGGDYEMGRVSFGVPADRKPYRLRHRLVSADGSALAEIVLNMEPGTIGPDGGGAWMKGADASGGYAVESFMEFEGLAARIRTTFADITGADVDDALVAVRFLSHWVAGNRLEVAGEKGPFFPLLELGPEVEALVDEPILRVLEALSVIQTRSTRPIRVPDLFRMTRAEAAPILDAAALISGQQLIGTWREMKINKLDSFQPDDDEYVVLILDNYTLKIEGPELFLGVSGTQLASARHDLTQSECVIVPASNNQAIRQLDVNAGRLTPGQPNVKARRVIRH
ncbi:MAG TPA: hypothetical protein VFW65_29305 [Pseudonocardiaceae bacterium]|nr:hypothetical protein [Pseudonocardiaceae bacterium]